MKIVKNEPLIPPMRGVSAAFLWLDSVEVGDCIIFDEWKKFERTRDALRYRKIKHTTRTIKSNQRTEWRIWILSETKKSS